ncbi:MAG: hypothetical protein EP347_11625 [Alphaproteobacteria bacterium]|nr:MAG: hypothetical protein EP347_11625 [Alphaproteobacteria bacterium]
MRYLVILSVLFVFSLSSLAGALSYPPAGVIADIVELHAADCEALGYRGDGEKFYRCIFRLHSKEMATVRELIYPCYDASNDSEGLSYKRDPGVVTQSDLEGYAGVCGLSLPRASKRALPVCGAFFEEARQISLATSRLACSPKSRAGGYMLRMHFYPDDFATDIAFFPDLSSCVRRKKIREEQRMPASECVSLYPVEG